MVEQIEEVAGEEFEMAVSVATQQKAALYAIVTGLLEIGNAPHKKYMKGVAKQLKREVIAEMGRNDGATELLSQNKGACAAVLAGIRNDPRHTASARTKILNTIKAEWLRVFNVGIVKLGIRGK